MRCQMTKIMMLPAMAKLRFYCIFLLYILIKCESASVDTISSDIRFKNVDRTIDISTQLVRITSKLTLENTGSTPVKNFLIAVESSAKNNAAFAGAKDSNNKDLRVVETTVKGYEYAKFWRVDLKEAVNPGATPQITVTLVLTKALLPYPTAITQQEDQLVKYIGNLYIYSPYYITSQKTSVILSSKSVESFTKVKPFTQQDGGIQYGPYPNVKPFSEKELAIHYKNNSPFLTVTRIERLIEVSHWGNIAVEEVIEIEHTGAKLKGPFSRYDYQQDHHSGPASVRSYKTLLPASASDVYYRDTNGNISTSNMKVKKDSVELDLRPRYPLFGGWRTHYTLGYNVPSYEYLYQSGNDYLLKMRVIDHIYDDMQVDEVVTKIILPEGSTSVKVNLPYPVTRLPDSLHYTYLDTKGRPVISFTKKNIVENHIEDFQLRYTFPRLLMLQEPLLVVGFLYALFLCVIIYVRLDFSIHKAEHPHKD
ncbi:dolichyl-diphosphooligosaccharide--protein glycosyltransferase subunit 1 [Helicoverpa armigera]|uniref:dolichyl-diphosphooligosaccharide--protein glycosyltransferase subunit 1 n=1 Tax=Helicoverpa armigera TaxID=29058 RepID=UPI001F561CA4|nr:dolichyl-diphosphooligosaccharide--protein glycosyltransferase subunit 1 [Helicoverpa armigera]XP_047022086.1 dolichyl-diphosphooligosaccharide--protein glycosyltransferase subunit 1 [Helicoverpa zea]